MKKTNQHGFGAIEILIIIVVLAAAVGAGGYVWKSKRHKPEKKVETVICDSPASAKGWLQYEPHEKGYKVCLPDGWQIYETVGLDAMQTNKNSDLVYKQGTLATVTKGSPSDSTFVFSISPIGTAQFQQEAKGDKTQITLVAGTTIDKYTFVQTAEPTAVVNTPKGATDYAYFVRKAQKTIRIDYRVLAGEQSNLDAVEKMVQSVVIN